MKTALSLTFAMAGLCAAARQAAAQSRSFYNLDDALEEAAGDASAVETTVYEMDGMDIGGQRAGVSGLRYVSRRHARFDRLADLSKSFIEEIASDAAGAE